MISHTCSWQYHEECGGCDCTKCNCRERISPHDRGTSVKRSDTYLEFTDEFGDKLRLGNAGLGYTGVATRGPQGVGPVYVLSPEEAVLAAERLLRGHWLRGSPRTRERKMKVAKMISNETLQRMAKGPTAFPAHALKDALEELIARRQSGTVYAVIQEGGSSLELYLHVHDTPEAAEAHRLSCANNGYRTTEPIGLPDNTNWSAMETLLQSVSTLDYPERDGEPPLCGCGARHWVHED